MDIENLLEFEYLKTKDGYKVVKLLDKSITAIEIPSTYNGKPIVSIGEYCFFACEELKTVIIPNTVKKIGGYAFSFCNSLISIEIPSGVIEIGDSAFALCESLTNVTIPNSVTTIETAAFYHCDKITNIKIPKSVTKIGAAAFEHCNLQKKDKNFYYKAFNKDLTCRDFQYKENQWFEIPCDKKIQLCRYGFHACENAFDLFNYYSGKLNKDIVIYKVELQEISKENYVDSKVVARKIRLVEKINSYAELLNKES